MNIKHSNKKISCSFCKIIQLFKLLCTKFSIFLTGPGYNYIKTKYMIFEI